MSRRARGHSSRTSQFRDLYKPLLSPPNQDHSTHLFLCPFLFKLSLTWPSFPFSSSVRPLQLLLPFVYEELDMEFVSALGLPQSSSTSIAQRMYARRQRFPTNLPLRHYPCSGLYGNFLITFFLCVFFVYEDQHFLILPHWTPIPSLSVSNSLKNTRCPLYCLSAMVASQYHVLIQHLQQSKRIQQRSTSLRLRFLLIKTSHRVLARPCYWAWQVFNVQGRP